jgi:hypothetical protein
MKFSSKRTWIVGAFLATSAFAFQPPHHNRASRTFVLANPNQIVTPEETHEGVTPNQLKALRKEASKRKARNTLAQQLFVADLGDNEEQVEAFFSAVSEDLVNNELCEVRGVSIDDKRLVFRTAEQLAYDLSVEMQRGVTIVNVQGHAVTLFCSSADPSKRKVLLRTSYQEGAWSKREKAPRDHRGQMIQN